MGSFFETQCIYITERIRKNASIFFHFVINSTHRDNNEKQHGKQIGIEKARCTVIALQFLPERNLRSGPCYRKSFCRLSVVCNVRAPYSGG